MSTPEFHPGQIIDLTIASLSHGGSGVGRIEDFVVFVPYTAPGDRVRVRLLEIKKNYAEGELLEVTQSSHARIHPPCPVFGAGKCGGCQWQHVDYKEQLRQKQNIVEHALSRIAREEGARILPIIASPREFHYRNRAQFRTQGKKVGFFRRNSHEIIEFEKCLILDEALNEELLLIREENSKTTNPDKTSKIEAFIGLDGKVHRSVNRAHGEKAGFSQVNTLQNENLQDYVCTLAGHPNQVDTDNLGSSGNLLDLYCGNGNFSFPLNQKGWRIYGIDSSKQAIRQARAHANQMTFFSAADCAYETSKLAARGRKFQTILLDPPRIGADESVLANVAKLLISVTPSLAKLIYVSCNPATFARDWARLKARTSLTLVSVQPFDMFPQTFHVELVALAQ